MSANIVEFNPLSHLQDKEAGELPTFEAKLLYDLCCQVTDLLGQYPDSMLQFSPHQIMDFVAKGMGTIFVNEGKDFEIVAFAKLMQWPGTTTQGAPLFELGSWLVASNYMGQGWGTKVMLDTVKKGKIAKPNAQIIGVAEHNNLKSQQVMLANGGKLLNPDQWPSNLEIVLQDGKADVVVIDITDV